MSRINRPVVIYLSEELITALDAAARIQDVSRSSYIKERLLEHFSENSIEKRLKLLGEKK